MRPRIALLGCGAMASAVHARFLARTRRADLVVVADPSPEARERAARIAGVEVTADPEEAIERPDVGAVVVCAATDTHAQLGRAVLQAGKHLYLEKPLAVSVDEGEALVAEAERAGVIAAIGFNRRFHPLFARARALVAAGEIGRVVAGHAAFCERIAPDDMPAWKRRVASGGGVLLDLATHHLDLVPWIAGLELVGVEVTTSSRATEEDSAWVSMSLADGADVAGYYSFVAGRSDEITLFGERGSLRVDRYGGSIAVWARREDVHAVRPRRIRDDRPTLAWRARRLLRPADEPSYRRALDAWIDAVSGAAHDLPTLREALDDLRALESARAA